MPTPDEKARELIDAKLDASGWIVQSYSEMNLGAGLGLAVTEFPGAHGPADYLLYVDGKAIGVVEAKPVGHTLKGVEGQSASYSEGLPESLPAWRRPLPFQYESTGAVTQSTDWMEPDACSRDIFSFHRPETLHEMIQADRPLRGWLRQMPAVPETGLWPKQLIAIRNLEESLHRGKPQALIQMATGSGKTFTAANIAYRLFRHGHARRVCFLVDRTNLGTQTLKEFQQFQPPEERHTFDRIYNAAFPRRNRFDSLNRVVITTIQRLYSVLTNQPELADEDEERSTFEGSGAFKKPPVPITYNPALPPEFFDVIIVDECHRSIYSVWGDVLSFKTVNEEGELDTEDEVVVRQDFWVSTANKQLNFVQHIFNLLKVNGRVAVVVPDNVLFEGGPEQKIRDQLMKQCDVHTLLRLPTGIFYKPGVKANVIFFDRKPPQEKPWTKRLWVYDLRTNRHFTLKQHPIHRSDFDEFVELFKAGAMHKRKATWSDENPDGRWRCYDYEDLLKRDKLSLDLFWIRDDSLEDSASLPDPDILAAEIVEDLQDALEQFAGIAAALEEGKESKAKA